MYKKLVTMLILLVICFAAEVRAEEAGKAPAEQKKEKSELAKLLSKVDEDYKAVQALSGYTTYKKKGLETNKEVRRKHLKSNKVIKEGSCKAGRQEIRTTDEENAELCKRIS
ncbi:MAG: hypothetical protein SCABRO_03554 [Candidatus Scalindua brodae]|uniref:Uncharacterized protein n=1 Tax=Candidatus Scalindua brodae TaxID=237368 RepID=A0A0B0EDG8_9BACT|nr:MAG: hypothetical protein SCABRO_03554 [Candidatus Scalindua brodae]